MVRRVGRILVLVLPLVFVRLQQLLCKRFIGVLVSLVSSIQLILDTVNCHLVLSLLLPLF